MAAKRVLVVGAASAALAVAAFVLIAPAFLRPGADRLALVHTPRDYGVNFETVEFRPPDRPITLRAWWMPSEPAKAAIILVHGGGDDNRSLPYSDGLKLAHDLVGHGYSVLAVDLRNYGESDATSEGVTFGDAESNDIIGAMNYLGTEHPGLRYGGLGFSMGLTPTPVIADCAVWRPRIRHSGVGDGTDGTALLPLGPRAAVTTMPTYRHAPRCRQLLTCRRGMAHRPGSTIG